MLIFKNDVLIVNENPLLFIPYNTICYCVSEYGYIEFHTNDGKVLLVKTTIKQLAESLPDFFIRINRSTLLNLNYCLSFKTLNDKAIIDMSTQQSFSVSRRLKKTIRTKWLNHIHSRYPKTELL